MNLSEASMLILLQERKQKKDKISIINLYSLDIQSLSLVSIWNRVEYLSLKNNLIRDLSFLPYLPMLFYLDISNNSIEDFELLNIYNTYAYLGLSAPRNFLEKKILSIRNLCVGILSLDIQNEAFKELVIRNNPNILLFNGNFYSYNERMSLFNKIDSQNYNSSSRTTTSLMPQSNNDISLSKGRNDKPITLNNNLINQNVKELIEFIRDYNAKMASIYTKEKESNTIDKYVYNKHNQDSNSVIDKSDNSDYIMQKYEKRKLILLSKYIQRMIKYNTIINTNSNSEEYFSYNFIPGKKPSTNCSSNDIDLDISLFKLSTIQLQLLVLSIIVLYLLGVLSKEISIEILYAFYIKYNILPENSNELLRKKIVKFFDVEYFYLTCFFYDINDHLASLCKQLKLSKRKNERNQIDFGVVKYEELRKSLKILKLTTQLTSLQLYHSKITQLFNSNEVTRRSELIQSVLIKYLNDKNIFNETLQIIQFVNDFFISNHHYESLLIKDLSFDYRIFNEIKELMYKYIKNNKDSLSEKKFFEIKLKTLSNKYFFQSTKFANFLSIGSKTRVKTNICYYKSPCNSFKQTASQFYPEGYNKEQLEKSQQLMNELKSLIQIRPEKRPIKLNGSKEKLKTNYFNKKRGSNNKTNSSYTCRYSMLWNTKQTVNTTYFQKKENKESMSKSMTNIIPSIRELPKVKGFSNKKKSIYKRNNYNQDWNKLLDKNLFPNDRSDIMC